MFPPGPGSAAATEPPRTAADLAPQTILVVDDDVDVRAAIADVLGDAGYLVEIAPNGAVALERLRTLRPRPALLVLDLEMPGLTGWQVLEQLRSQPQIAPRIVVVSAVEDAATPIPGVRWARKPIAAENLLAVVRATLAA